jgi:hypothetical protein
VLTLSPPPRASLTPCSTASISLLPFQLKDPPRFIHQSLNTVQNVLTSPPTVGKSHKFNDRDHAGLADGTALPAEHLPRYFAKSGHVDADPKKTKKNGAGKGGW